MSKEFDNMVARARQAKLQREAAQANEAQGRILDERRRQEVRALIVRIVPLLPAIHASRLAVASHVTRPAWDMDVRYMIADGEYGPDYNYIFLGDDASLYARTNSRTLPDGRIPASEIFMDDSPTLGYSKQKPTSSLVREGLANLVAQYDIPL